MAYEPRIGDDLQIECIARFGVVFQRQGGSDSAAYWQTVWDWLSTQHAHLLDDPTADYAGRGAGVEDIETLQEFWDWQDEHYNGSKSL